MMHKPHTNQDLIDFIHGPEGTSGDLLQGHEVQHGRHTPFPSTLPVCTECLQLLTASELNKYLHTILAKILSIAMGMIKGGRRGWEKGRGREERVGRGTGGDGKRDRRRGWEGDGRRRVEGQEERVGRGRRRG